jgi:hypothetical protein
MDDRFAAVIRGLDPRIHPLLHKRLFLMDHRVKHGDPSVENATHERGSVGLIEHALIVENRASIRIRIATTMHRRGFAGVWENPL